MAKGVGGRGTGGVAPTGGPTTTNWRRRAEHLYTYGWVADYPDPENFLDLLLHSEAHDSRYANPLYDRSIGTGAGGTLLSSDRESRLNLYREAEQLLMDDAGIIPLFHVKDYVLVRPHVRGFGISPIRSAGCDWDLRC